MDAAEISNQLDQKLGMALWFWAQTDDSADVAAKTVWDHLKSDGNLGWYSSGIARNLTADLINKHGGNVTLAIADNHDCEGLFTDAELAQKIGELVYLRKAALKVEKASQSLIDQLIQQTNLYTTSKSFTDLLDFVARMRGFAPFNAMLLHTQKPGITHAASASDWLSRFNRRPKQDARPLIVMQAMGPVGFVFDVLDTEGDPLPPEAFAFPTFGNLSKARWHEMLAAVARAKIETLWVDKGDGAAGSMTRREMVVKGKVRAHWTVRVNQNHTPQTQFVTLAHELAHMFLGHLGGDDNPSIKARWGLGHDLQEVEAETVAWVVAHRNGLKPNSEAYLDRYKAAFKGLEVGTILRAANAVETAMGISAAQLVKAGRPK